ncbi:MAG: aspartate/tyrosine/aromatic aminotransferase [SAR324 cluster bacterium]|uniref:Aminotransferase n=1 Tax=SAR324 cluster bacterium TaxID=2024889 RepID=A0A7X9IK17_9DELT|nr:aspartate/tyrosine/aromatic aminotransferase [SAR324 cluster bacterium]
MNDETSNTGSQSFLENLPSSEGDPIFALTERFKNDNNPNKVNLGIGVYQDNEGRTSFLKVVQKVQKIIVEEGSAAGYLPLDGNPDFNSGVLRLVFGAGSSLVEEGRIFAAQTPGGTGGLRVAADFLKSQAGISVIYVSKPTWVNHVKVFSAAGLETKYYSYLASDGYSLDIEAAYKALKEIKPGSAVLFHACCHNPTGVDLNEKQWRELLEICSSQKLIPFFDFAYQGFATGLDEDARPLRLFAEEGVDYIAAYSCSKNFSMYGERLGALIVASKRSEWAKAALGCIKAVIRANYSNPPTYASRVVSRIIKEPDLFKEWADELKGMRERIKNMRSLLVKGLSERGVKMPYILNQNGMFSYTGLNPEQVKTLEEQFGVYIVAGGRMCVAALNTNNLDYVCESIAKVAK